MEDCGCERHKNKTNVRKQSGSSEKRCTSVYFFHNLHDDLSPASFTVFWFVTFHSFQLISFSSMSPITDSTATDGLLWLVLYAWVLELLMHSADKYDLKDLKLQNRLIILWRLITYKQQSCHTRDFIYCNFSCAKSSGLCALRCI